MAGGEGGGGRGGGRGGSSVRTATLLVFLMVLFSQGLETLAWSGNIEPYTYCSCISARECAYRTWTGGCCAYRWVWKEVCTTYYRCQTGWREISNQNCIVPMCSYGCGNGTCTAPNVCTCPPDIGGSTCGAVLNCDVLKPCYPGLCEGSCSCTSGFSGSSGSDTCRILDASQKPEIFTCTSIIRNVDRVQNMEKYRYTVESANPNDTDVEVLWSNYRMFNYIEMEGYGTYNPSLPARPEFIVDSQLGVVKGEVRVVHTKISRTQGIEVSYDRTWPCNLTVETECRIINNLKVCSVWQCRAMESSYTTQFETGDNLTMTLSFESGGVRNVQRDSYQQYQEFQRQRQEKTLVFRFDADFPEHTCMNNTHNCPSSPKPLDVGASFTKSAIPMRWGGWTDRVSGMYRYVWEVFALQPNGAGELRETAPLSPVNDITTSVVNHSNIQFPTFTPPQPGIYSVILQAADLANNSVYVRQFVLYDPDSTVSVDEAFPLRVAEATSMGYVRDLTSSLNLTWSRHFLNKFHEDNKAHGPILPYPRQFDDTVQLGIGKAKYIWDEVSIGPGQNRKYAREQVPNARGIRRFRVQETADGTSPSSTSWIELSLSEAYTFPSGNHNDGDKRRLWVEAEDWLGNTKTDSMLIRFDASPPIVDTPATAQRNFNTSEFTFASRIAVGATDPQSPVTHYRLQFTRSDTEAVVHNETIWNNPEVPYSECIGSSCMCVEINSECFQRQVSIPINNCWLQVPRDVINQVSVDVTVTPINAADNAGNSSRVRFNNLAELSGILNYAGPTDVTTSLLTHESVRLNWTNRPTCLEVSEWWVKYYINDVETKYFVDRRESVFMLPGLSPSTTYDIYIITGYNGVMSEPERIVITTLSQPFPTTGQLAGIVVGSLLLLLIILMVIVAILYMNGLLFVMLRRPIPENRYRPSFMKRREKRSTGGVDGDVYIYGGDVAVPLGKQIADDRLTLVEVVGEGRFARIYKANLNTDGRNETVAAKMLKEDRMTAEDAELMKTKMAYMTREVPSHPNVLQCLGGIMESPWGPVMVLEFCENDSLQNWLTSHRKDVTDDVVERLYHFAHGVVKGMECLASAKIVHKRLAARNVLLTFTLDVKVAGFGPTHLPGEEDQVKERLPVRWLPPECSNSVLNAEESTDVWSFGVTLWEIFSMGEKPYNNVDAHSIAMEVRRGRRLPKPEYCDETNFAMMQRCWAEKPSKRPSFKQLLREYDRMMSGDHRLSTYNYGNPTYQP